MSDWPLVAPSDPQIKYRPALDKWEVEEAYTVRDPMSGHRIDVPKHFLAEPSVPRPFWRAIPPHHLGTLGPTTHDRIYGAVRDTRWTRAQADRLFLLLMLLDGVKAWKAVAAFVAVSLCGGSHWRRHA